MLNLGAIKARLAAATPGPWKRIPCGEIKMVYGPDGRLICRMLYTDEKNPDLDLIENAPTDIAALVAEVEALRSALAETARQLEAGGAWAEKAMELLSHDDLVSVKWPDFAKDVTKEILADAAKLLGVSE